MKRYTLLLPLLAACASSGTGGGGTAGAPATVVHGAAGIQVSTTAEREVSTAEVPAPVGDAWRVLPEVYVDLGLPMEVDAGSRTVRAEGATITRRLAGHPARQFFDCGRGQFGVEVASSHTVRMNARTTVQPGSDAGTSRLETTIEAYAVNRDGANSIMAQCRSRGTLEALIAENVRSRLAP